MKLDQTKENLFFDYIGNETDNELVHFIEAREIDTEELKETVNRKIKELQKVLKICEACEMVALVNKAEQEVNRLLGV